MCDCDNIEVVGIKKGDTLVFFVDTDYYDLEDIGEVMENVKEAFQQLIRTVHRDIPKLYQSS